MSHIYRLNLYIPIILAVFIMSLFTVFAIIYAQENSIHESKKNTPALFTKYLNEKVDSEAAVLGEYIDFIQNMKNVTEQFKASNKQELNNSIKEIYDRLNKNINLTHMYFIKPDGTVLLRTHDYEKDSDIVERTTFKKAQELQSIYYGLEFGLKKNYTLRVVKPWYVDGKLIGYLELGKEIDKVIDDISGFLETHIYLAVKKEIYKDAPTFVQEELKQKVETANHYISYSTFDIPHQMKSILTNDINLNDIEFKKNTYFVSKSMLSDVSSKDIGYFVFLSDVSLEHTLMHYSAKIVVIILTIISSALIIGAYILIQKKERSIYLLTSELNGQKEELSHFNVKLQKLFDLQKNIVIITDKKKLIMANQTMYEFFGLDDIESFFKHHNCICEKFVNDDEFFHLGKVPKDQNWVKAIINLSGDKRIVSMLDYNMTPHTFSVSANEFEEGSYIVSFTDISYTMMEHKKLQLKLTHDKLTNALNREFFDNNINLIIEETKPHRLGVIICDIDYFKNVNDTYGHNRGDIVLKILVNTINESIRQEDYLIRWGGEEFIILMKIDTLNSIEKRVEYIRKQIEKQYFEEVTNVTASFGGTIYKEDETITQCIERADKALYTAKENGRNQIKIV
ncbi:MAG: diguanylate cyclase [Sulfurimonas sp.]|uniref:diguanylate cyclase domain-containing protein n=1 Tax=Sulfurimonas sp. TaxID=2022749 RepID=UPI00261C7BA9|nr:diguanylate cyclase [Sulfurimonas sp.]MDD5401594.1 diguanylate cyclase [Sulfurimonas sp.]